MELCAKNGDLADKVSQLKMPNAAGGIVLDHRKSVAGSCERPLKRAKVARSCKNSFTTPFTVALLALLAERETHKNCCEALILKNQCILGLAAEAMDLRKELAELEKARQCRTLRPEGRKKCATAADKRTVTWSRAHYC